MKSRSLAGKTSFLKKLFPFLILFFSVIRANAQIVYTDVAPDAIISGVGIYSLDLDNDGSGTVTLNVSSGITHCGYGDGHQSQANATPKDGSKIAQAANCPGALLEGEVIGSSLAWSSNNDQVLRHAEFGSSSFCNSSFGKWSNPSDHYLGLKMVSSGNTYYGWARLSVFVTGFSASVTIKDYAFNSNPDSSILAGQTCPPQAMITATGSTTFCMGDSVILSSSNAGTNLSYKWKLNGSNISGATNKSFTAKFAGKYKVNVKDNTNGCSATSALVKVKVPCRVLNEELNADENVLLKVYPNPFSQSTTISFSLLQSGKVSLRIFDSQGRLIRTLVENSDLSGQGNMNEGEHTLMWNAKDENGNKVSEGIYLLQLLREESCGQTSVFLQTAKLMVTK
ncbi:MAG: T9SS type A sorting domain-containing protein [Chitinophagaceae bacterium]|nr:T9SS type A sorting domain-containing protein [Chitinophagaceae bacterium]